MLKSETADGVKCFEGHFWFGGVIEGRLIGGFMSGDFRFLQVQNYRAALRVKTPILYFASDFRLCILRGAGDNPLYAPSGANSGAWELIAA